MCLPKTFCRRLKWPPQKQSSSIRHWPNHATLAFIHAWFDWDWAGSQREAKRAIELNPNWAIGHIAYAAVLSHLGRMRKPLRRQRARELDVLSLYVRAVSGQYLYSAGRYDEASVLLKKALELDANFWLAHLFLGEVDIQAGKLFRGRH
jgi:tetratricopeptide (TPR) repeat protein